MHTWQIQEAKARLSEIVRDAQREGPQEITHHGHPVAVLLSRTDYDRLSGAHQSLLDFMRASPFYGLDDVVFERNRSLTRDVGL